MSPMKHDQISRRAFLPAVIVLTVVSFWHSQVALSQSAPPTAPPAAYSIGAAYDVARERLVVFGGYLAGQYVADTWEWDGRDWRRMATSGPIARNSPALAYDETRHQVVLFGGDTRETGALGDTWVYDGKAWRQVASDGPPARTTHQMVYDAKRGRIVLFGGIGGGPGSTMYGDTWEWDGERWTRMATDGPAARTLHGLAYDPARGKVVLFGGTSVLAPNAPSYGDTWEWDGVTWTRVSTSGPSARDHVAMGYDATRRVVVLHGGGLGPIDPGETWGFDGRSWSRISASGPRRRFAKIVFDTRTKALLVYGGFDDKPSNELWALTGSDWRKLAP